MNIPLDHKLISIPLDVNLENMLQDRTITLKNLISASQIKIHLNVVKCFLEK